MANDDFLWVEKYRPKHIKDCILPVKIKNTFLNFLKSKDFTNLLFVGSAGLGKTTVAKALCEELEIDYIVVNGSDEGRFLDTIRTSVANFVTGATFISPYKAVIIDEADNTTYDVQCCLRAFIEKYSKDCRFIFTGNYANKIIPAIHSRCTVVNFTPNIEDKKSLMLNFAEIVHQILFLENIKCNKKTIVNYIKMYYPDWRKLLNKVQSNSSSGELLSIDSYLKDVDVKSLITYIKDKDFTSIREWVVSYIHIESSSLLKIIYEEFRLHNEIRMLSVFPDMIVNICKYMEFSSKVADQEINILACIMELMILYHENK